MPLLSLLLEHINADVLKYCSQSYDNMMTMIIHRQTINSYRELYRARERDQLKFALHIFTYIFWLTHLRMTNTLILIYLNLEFYVVVLS